MVFNGAQLHLMVNHLPVVGFVGVVIALCVAALVKSIEIKRFVLLMVVFVGLSALAPYFTGEAAEEVVENLGGVDKNLIDIHEDIAKKSTFLSLIIAMVALAAFITQHYRPTTLKISIPFVLFLSVIGAIFMGLAAHDGGMIRHPEISPQSSRR